MDINLKTCSKCGQIKHSLLFERNKFRCKECVKKYSKTLRDKIKHTKRYRDMNYVRTQRYKLRNPHKRKARRQLEAAVRSGKLVKTQCVDCGNANVEAHHQDYLKPLDVIWLCKHCHELRHHQTINLVT